MTRTFTARNSTWGGRCAAWGRRLGMLLLPCLLLAQPGTAQKQELGGRMIGKFAPDLAPALSRAQKGAQANETVKVIVQYNQTPRALHEARMQGLGGRVNRRLEVVNGLAVTVPVRALFALEADPDVTSIGVDHLIKAMDEYTDAGMNVSAAWNAGYIGTGVGVAVIDSGINDQHIDIWDRVPYHQDFTGTTEYNSQGALVRDTYGHGTHVAGIIAGSGWVSGQIYGGVAYNATLIDLRVLDRNGSGNDSEVIAAIQQAIALKSKYNIKVINLSLGRGVYLPYAQDPLCQAVESAWKAGIVVVVAAGNYGRVSVDGSNGYATITAPGNDPYVITVGAMNTQGTLPRTDDTITSYSSKGPTMYDHVVKPDLVAPGNQVVSLTSSGSTLATNYPGNAIGGFSNDYFMLSGTSMAAPAASGAAALLLDAHPTLTPDQVKARLMKTAYKTFPTSSVATDPTTGLTYTSYYDIFTIGAGYLDLAAAFANTDLASSKLGAALSPSVAYNSSTKKVSLVNGNSSVASSSVVWGTSVLWGTSVVWGTNVAGSSVLWGTSVVWGTSTMEGFSVLWGTTTDTSDQVIWGTALNSSDAAMTLIYGDEK